MKIKTISVTYSRTFNLGNYNSAKFEYQIAAELEDGDDVQEVERDLWLAAKDNIKEAALPVIKSDK
jgi:hypothetical protein